MEHPIYQMDQAFAAYLEGVLQANLGEPFQRWKKAEEEVARLQTEETRRLAREAAANAPLDDMTLQEKLVPSGLYYPPLNQAWGELKASAAPVWETLLELYNCVLIEVRDWENMILAIELAEQEGGAAHAAQVRKILDLDEITEILWWAP